MTERTFFRLRFPLAATLPFKTSHGEFSVCELSEGGLRILCEGDPSIRVGQPVRGTLILTTGEHIDVKGFAVRREQDELVITQAEGITFQHMMAEQRNLVHKYPTSIAPTPPATDPRE